MPSADPRFSPYISLYGEKTEKEKRANGAGPLLPADGNTARIITLARYWSAAAASITKQVRRNEWLRGGAPWENPDPKFRRRWNDFVRLDARLIEWGASSQEFCAAAMDYFRWFGTARLHGAFRPNVRQVSGEKGRGIWLRWRERRKAEGAGSEAWVRQTAARETMSAPEKLMADLRHAVAACRREGPEWAVTTVWGPEVLWCLWAHEPAARPAVQALLEGALGAAGSSEVVALRAAVLAIKADPTRRQVLARLRHGALGTAAPVLRRAAPVAVREETSPLPPTVTRQEWAEAGVAVMSDRDRDRFFRARMARFLSRTRQQAVE